MRTKLLFLIAILISVIIVKGQTTKTVGGSGANYSTLQLAFAAINGGAIQGQIILQITGSTTETASAVLSASGTGSARYTSLLIYPTTTATISTTGNWPAIDLNGADFVTIDGRINQSGTPNSLTISNTNITGNVAAAIRFLNSAESNTVRYCILSGSSSNSSVGIVTFGSSNTGSGNNNNTLEYCNLTNSGSRPYNAILSGGTSGRENTGAIIRNNNIYDTFNPGLISSNGININSASIGFTISNNSIYETTEFIPTVNLSSFSPIHITTTNEHTISGNYIGGSLPQCGGSALKINGHIAVYFCGIYVYAGTGTATKITNNTISNIDFTSTEDNPWDGIFLYSGNFDVTGNTIGSSTGTGSIISRTPVAVATATMSGGVVTAINLANGGSGYTTAPTVTFSVSGSTTPATVTAVISGSAVTGFTGLSGGAGYTSVPSVIFDGQSNNYSTSHGIINNSIGTVNITGNNIGSITTVGSDYYSHGFESVYVRGASGTTTLSNNLIGSLTTANSIQVSSAAASSLLKQDVYGLYCNSASGTNIITGNTIANLTNYYTGLISLSRTRGIAVIAGTNTIQNNTVRDLKTSSKQSTGGSAASVTGITQSSTTAGTIQTITGNTVYNLSNASPDAKVYVSGFYYSGPIAGTHSVSGNFIHSLSIASSDNLSDIEGIELAGGTFTCANNIVNLGVGISGGYLINGIWDESNSSLARSILFNSVYIGGTVSSGGSITAAFNNQFNTATRDFRNNVFFNARSGGTGKHYAYYLKASGNTGLTSDYNDYWTGSIGAIVAYVGADKTLATLQTATGGDGHSLNKDPLFTNASGTSAVNYATSAVLPGITGTGITTDYAGLTRPSTPKMGALESNSYVWYGNSGSTDFNTASNWLPAEVPPAGADITFAPTPLNHCVLDQNRTVGNITNAQGTYQLKANGHQLTINKDLTFSNSAQLDATATSSTVVFAGTSAQSIPSGAFYNNTIDALTLNNSNGLTLNGALTVVQTLTLTNGALNIGANTLTLNGAISKTSGSLAGGATSNLVFGGTANTTLPAIILNNLTLNRSGEISLGGNVNVVGTLALTSGVLTVGGNTLTISGSSPTSVSGTVDASNASANLVFANTSAIVLPVTIFTNAVNNLTLSGIGGVTAGSDITVNGVLNLSANPDATHGALDMGAHTLTMALPATNTGLGDVTGTVIRNGMLANTIYTFGHQKTTVALTGSGLAPAWVSMKTTIGSVSTGETPAASPAPVKRYYEVNIAATTAGLYTDINFHYLDAELNGNAESTLVTGDYDIPDAGSTSAFDKAHDEHGRAAYDVTTSGYKFLGLAGVPITYYMYVPGQTGDYSKPHDYRTIFSLYTQNAGSILIWKGTVSNVWTNSANWDLQVSGHAAPAAGYRIIIPDHGTTGQTYDPVLPLTAVDIQSIRIGNGISLTALNDITIRATGAFGGGAWEDLNSDFSGFIPGIYEVTFTGAHATISGNTQFNNLTVASGGDITNMVNNYMKISGTVTKTGIWYADLSDATVEYNGGNQTVVLPDGTPNYHHLTLSGSGTKTFPVSALTMHGNLAVSGTATVTAAGNMKIGGNLSVGSGTIFGTGAFTHTVGGEILCDGTMTAAPGSSVTCGSHFTNNGTFTGASTSDLTFNGSAIQTIGGTSATTFGNVTIDNSAGAKITSDALTTLSGNLTINASKKLELLAGKQLTVSGSIANYGGMAGLVIRSESDAYNGSGSLINGTSGVSATVERWMTSDIWHLISPSATGQTPTDFITDAANGIASNSTNYGLAPYNESTDDWDYFKVAGITGSLNEAGKGYQVLRNADGIVSFKGALAGANQTKAVVKTGNGWNLIGNPYPCALDIKKFLDANSSVDNIPIDQSYLGIYVANVADVTNFGYIPVNYSNGANALKLASGEAFFVKSKAGSGTVSFTTAMKTHTSDAFKSAVLDPPAVTLFVEDGAQKLSTTVNYISGMTKGLDPGFDAGLFNGGGGSPFTLFTRLIEDNGVDFTIQCLPDNNFENMVVPVGMRAASGSAVTFKAVATNLPSDLKVVLEDRVTNTFTRLDGGGTYSVTLNTASAGPGRFFLRTGTIVSAVPGDLTVDLKVVALPNQQIIQVFGNVNLPARALVYDMNGKLFTAKVLTGIDLNEIPLVNAANGLYLLKIESNKAPVTQKVRWIRN